MGFSLSVKEKRELAANGGALLRPLPGATGQPKRVYYDVYGRQHRFGADAWSLEHYVNRGFSLRPPANPLPIPEADQIGVSDWDGDKQTLSGDEHAPSSPVATYYTQDGTRLANLPADPESMAAYLAQGLSLSNPVAELPERPRLRVVEPERERRQPRRRRFVRKTG